MEGRVATSLLLYSSITIILYVGKVKFPLFLFFLQSFKLAMQDFHPILYSTKTLLVDLSVAIMHVNVAVAIIQLEVSAALIQATVSASNMWVTILIAFMQVGVSVAVMKVVLSAVHNCFYCKMQVTVSVIAM